MGGRGGGGGGGGGGASPASVGALLAAAGTAPSVGGRMTPSPRSIRTEALAEVWDGGVAQTTAVSLTERGVCAPSTWTKGGGGGGGGTSGAYGSTSEE